MTSMEMHAEHIEELAEGYALGALAPGERVRVEQHIAACPPCKRHIDSVEDTTHMLAFVATPVAPPPRCKLKLMEKVAREQFLQTPTRRSRTVNAMSMWAAVATVAFIMSGAWSMRLQQQLSEVTGAQNQIQGQLASMQTERATMTAQIAQLTTLESVVAAAEAVRSLHGAGSAANASAKTYMTPGKNEAVLIVHNLPQLPPGKIYQVWVARPELQQPLTMFNPVDTTEPVPLQPPEPMDSYNWIMVTIEDAAGAQQPSKDTVLFGEL
ncbi:MAG: anti-sigma factor [Chloroflexota bacterium]|nr:anti-sigma factor [Chloroflexota bacterium]